MHEEEIFGAWHLSLVTHAPCAQVVEVCIHVLYLEFDCKRLKAAGLGVIFLELFFKFIPDVASVYTGKLVGKQGTADVTASFHRCVLRRIWIRLSLFT